MKAGLEVNPQQKQGTFLSNIFNKSEHSFAQFKISDMNTKVAFLSGSGEKTRFVVVSTDGHYYLVEFSEQTGGECKLIENIDFLDMAVRVKNNQALIEDLN